MPYQSKPCAECGAMFEPESGSQKWCSTACREDARRQSCRLCGQAFLPKAGTLGLFCSRACSNKTHGPPAPRPADPFRNQRKCAKRRARMFTTQVEDIDPSIVFERDDWRCYLCGRPVIKDGSWLRPDYATIDHVIALANGGAHTYDNLRCACRECNVRKGARDAGSRASA